MTTPATPSRYPICRHIKTNGHRCQSPAVHRGIFCHFHRTLHDAHTKGFPPPNALGFMPVQHIEKMLSYGEPLAELARAFPTPDRMTLPPLEDAESVQVAISLIFSDMASGHLDHERARPLLYALQLASYNFRTLAQIQAAQARQPHKEDPMPHRVVRSRHGHTFAAPEEAGTAGCPVQAPPGQDIALNSPAPAAGKTTPAHASASPRRRRIARPDAGPAAEPSRPESLPGPAPSAAFPISGNQAPDDPAEDEPNSVEPTQTQLDRASWSGYVCKSNRESPSQPAPTSLQSARSAPISAPFTPWEDPELPAARLQPQSCENFTRNPNGMTLLASTPSPKPNVPLHLRPASSAEGEGGVSPTPAPNNPAMIHQARIKRRLWKPPLPR